eukprot:2871142-Pleurochrysis_carterae.AAC.3
MGALNASIAIFLLGDSGKKNKARGCTAAVFDMLRQHWASIAAVLVAINPLPACTMQSPSQVSGTLSPQFSISIWDAVSQKDMTTIFGRTACAQEKLRAFIEENGGLPEPFRNLRNAGEQRAQREK